MQTALRDFDREGFGPDGPRRAAVNQNVRQAIAENLSKEYQEGGNKKWLRHVQISDWNTSDEKVKKLAGLMSLLVGHATSSRIVRDVARAILRGYDVEAKDHPNELWAIQHWIHTNLRYVFDTGEQFQTPQRVLIDWFHNHDGADCDCLTMLYLSLAAAVGHQKVAIGLLDSRGDGVISHAIGLVKLPRPSLPWGHKWIPVELTKRVKFGWLTPNATKLLAVPIRGRNR